jgi:decaprenylphospho-beta-D-ribofuranose 2-oxidase
MSYERLIEAALPLGWFPVVTPGTKHVTMGGALACDVHGKNHHRDGAFAAHVEGFRLVTPTGELLDVDKEASSDAFWATAGGLGLTGVVVDLSVRLTRVETGWMSVDTERARDLDDAFQRFAGDDDYRYSVAWIDCLATGSRLGRAVLFRGEHAGLEQLRGRDRKAPLATPAARRVTVPWAPSGLVNRLTVGAFNEAYFRRARASSGRIVSLDAFFYPLDRINSWNRLYGADGFVQYQFVVPFGEEETVRVALETVASSGCASFLGVLKRFGPEQGLISFPMPGWTLALDIPVGGDGLVRLLDRLDEVVAAAGGRVYLAKDSRLRPDLLGAMYPQFDRWRLLQARLDPAHVMRSDLSRRLGLAA